MSDIFLTSVFIAGALFGLGAGFLLGILACEFAEKWTAKIANKLIGRTGRKSFCECGCQSRVRYEGEE